MRIKPYMYILLLLILSYSIIFSVLAEPFEYKTAKNGFKYVYHKHSESSYQHAWCKAHNGIEEYENIDKTRVDCLTKDFAVELDFACGSRGEANGLR